MSEKKSYVCGVTVFKDGIEKEQERMDTIKEYLKDQLVYKAINEMDAGEYVITLHDVRSFDVPLPYDDQVDFKQKLIVQPLVRCKDCKHKVVNELGWTECEMESLDPYEHTRDVDNDNWFCADGERREDE